MLMEQLAKKDEEEQDQKHEHDTAKELINEATCKMAAAVVRNNMCEGGTNDVKSRKWQVAGNSKDTIGTKQRDLRKRLHDPNMKDVPPAKKIDEDLSCFC